MESEILDRLNKIAEDVKRNIDNLEAKIEQSRRAREIEFYEIANQVNALNLRVSGPLGKIAELEARIEALERSNSRPRLQ